MVPSVSPFEFFDYFPFFLISVLSLAFLQVRTEQPGVQQLRQRCCGLLVEEKDASPALQKAAVMCLVLSWLCKMGCDQIFSELHVVCHLALLLNQNHLRAALMSSLRRIIVHVGGN